MSGMSNLENAVARFEAAWQAGHKPRIVEFVRNVGAGAPPQEFRELVIELVKIDLEYRWKAAHAAGRQSALRLEAYCRRLPYLGPSERLPLDLITEEYRVRRRFGDAPKPQEYVARFILPRAALLAALDEVDRDLDREHLPVMQPRAADRRPVRPADAAAPLSFGDYVLKRQIGAGGMCRVYAGVNRRQPKEVAIKVLRRRWWNAAVAVDRFLREAQIVGQLPREGIVGIHGVGQLPYGGYFLEMELIDGLDLRARQEGGEVSVMQALSWVADTAELVQRVHDAGYIHGDLKPANILVEHTGGVVLTDFGFSQQLVAADAVEERELCGTPGFMAPEQVRDPRLVGPRADVYGLGAVLFWLLTGRPVHDGQTADEILRNLADKAYRPEIIGRIPASITDQVRDMCCRCLANEIDARPASAAALGAELRRFAQEFTESRPAAPRNTREGFPDARPGSRRTGR